MDELAIGIDVGGTAVKVAAVDRAGATRWAGRSPAYSRPSADQLAGAIREAAAGRAPAGAALGRCAVGVCVPGIMHEDGHTVAQSVNVPGLNGCRLDELATSALGGHPGSVVVTTDAHATAYDLYIVRRLRGRVFLLAIGTGVGAAVLDDGAPLRVDDDSPGHFGQVDVSIDGHPVVGPDGGAGSLEGYLSAGALTNRYGPDPSAWLSRITADDPPVRALARAVRVAHAIYRPHHVLLAGGIGVRLGHLVSQLRASVERQLTSIARPGWTLATGDSDYHAAQGVARLAISPP